MTDRPSFDIIKSVIFEPHHPIDQEEVKSCNTNMCPKVFAPRRFL